MGRKDFLKLATDVFFPLEEDCCSVQYQDVQKHLSFCGSEKEFFCLQHFLPTPLRSCVRNQLFCTLHDTSYLRAIDSGINV